MLVEQARCVCVIGACLLQSGCSIYDQAILEDTELRGASRNHATDTLGSADAMASIQRMRDTGARTPDAGNTAASQTERMRRRTSSMRTAMRGDAEASSPAAEREDEDVAQGSEDASSPATDAEVHRPRPVAEASMACRGRIGYVSPDDGHCYFLLTEPITWHMARDECTNSMAHLATLTSNSEQAFATSFGAEAEAWIGLSRFGAVNFTWVTNEIFAYAYWRQDGPEPRQESAVVMTPITGLWSDRSPEELHQGLCEIEP